VTQLGPQKTSFLVLEVAVTSCVFTWPLCLSAFSSLLLRTLVILNWEPPRMTTFYLNYLFFFFFCTRAWTQGLGLSRQVLYHLNHSPNFFCLRLFFDRLFHFSLMALDEDWILPPDAFLQRPPHRSLLLIYFFSFSICFLLTIELLKGMQCLYRTGQIKLPVGLF
jgi:hypothetical protein